MAAYQVMASPMRQERRQHRTRSAATVVETITVTRTAEKGRKGEDEEKSGNQTYRQHTS